MATQRIIEFIAHKFIVSKICKKFSQKDDVDNDNGMLIMMMIMMMMMIIIIINIGYCTHSSESANVKTQRN